MDSARVSIIVTTTIPLALITFRLAYRALCRCDLHVSCHRTWRLDDAYMAFAILPLLARAACLWKYDVVMKTPQHVRIGETAGKMVLAARILAAIL
jgi:hypothetical protein